MGFTSGETASEFPCSTLRQSSHGFATRVHGFSTETKALAREIPLATEATKSLIPFQAVELVKLTKSSHSSKVKTISYTPVTENYGLNLPDDKVIYFVCCDRPGESSSENNCCW